MTRGSAPLERPARRRALARLVPALALCLAAAPARAAQDVSAGTRRALLVGIEAYPEGSWKPLRGARADVRAMREVLLTNGGFEPAEVRVLLDEAATRDGILGAFEAMIEASGPEDLLLFYFAGHGSRLPDDQPDEEPDHWDETLVPYDAENGSESRDIRDDDIQRLIEAANEKTELVVFIFDCCSSGTNTRGGEGSARFVDPAERGIAGARSSSARPAAAAGDPASDYFPPALSYVSLAACQSYQSAFEHRIQEEGSRGTEERFHGLFTYCLVEELGSSEPFLTYEELLGRVARRVSSIRSQQVPVIEGNLRRRRLFDTTGGSVRAWTLDVVAGESGVELQLAAGRVVGLAPGAVFAVFDPGRPDEPLAEVRLTEVGAQRSSAALLASATLAPGTYRAVLRAHGERTDLLPVALVHAPELEQEARALAELVERGGEVRLTRPEEAAFHLVATPSRGGLSWHLAERGGERLPVEARADSADSLERLGLAVDRLGRLHRITERVRNEAPDGLDAEIEMVLIDEAGRELGPPERAPDGALILTDEQLAAFRIRNRSSVPIYATLLILSPTGAITHLWSTPTEEEPILPDEARRTTHIEMYLAEEELPFYAKRRDRFRWVVSTSFQDLLGLEQDSVLDLEGTRGARRATELPEGVGSRTQGWRTFDLPLILR